MTKNQEKKEQWNLTALKDSLVLDALHVLTVCIIIYNISLPYQG